MELKEVPNICANIQLQCARCGKENIYNVDIDQFDTRDGLHFWSFQNEFVIQELSGLGRRILCLACQQDYCTKEREAARKMSTQFLKRKMPM
jgi:hypothetical protein